MPQKKLPVPLRERRAIHEAGHAVVADHYGITIFEVNLAPRPGRSFASKFQRIEDYAGLQPGIPAKLAKLDQYLVFLLAGSAAEMTSIECHYSIVAKSAGQRRFRQKWYYETWLNPERHTDLAFLSIVAWTPIAAVFEIEKVRRRLWDRTCRLIEDPPVRRQIQRVAAMLLEGRHLDAAAVALAKDGNDPLSG